MKSFSAGDCSFCIKQTARRWRLRHPGNVRMMFGMTEVTQDDNDFSYRDALPTGPAHRRGAGINPGNRFETVRLHVLGEEIDRQWVEQQNGDGSVNRVERQVFLDRTQRIINHVVKTSDVPFDWTVNPYRGCEHGCIY